MADIGKVGRASLAAVTPPIMLATLVPDLIAGAAIAIGDSCYIFTDGQAYPSDGDVLASSRSWFIALDDYEIGQAVSDIAWPGTFIRYANALSKSAPLYVGSAPGSLADAATVNGTHIVARAVNAQVIYFMGSMDK